MKIMYVYVTVRTSTFERHKWMGKLICCFHVTIDKVVRLPYLLGTTRHNFSENRNVVIFMFLYEMQGHFIYSGEVYLKK
jgi:hypothetical protein